MDPWEALDVDDSDLPSLLRPCNKRRRESSTATSTSTTPQSQPIHLSPSSPDLPNLSQPSQSQTLTSPIQSLSHSSPVLIPGPAGAVQSAMLQKNRDRHTFSSQEQPIPTQEYVRRAIEDAEEDEDFQRQPWLSAIQFLTHGTVDGLIPSTPLNSIKKCINFGRADKVVAVIKSCTPNGFGDLMVSLKDPTGTVGGSIHRKVLSEGEFAKDISVGSVLILQKVAIFAPSRSAHYLNITLNNVLKVFHKDIGPRVPQKDSLTANAFRYADPDTEQNAETEMSDKEYPHKHGRTGNAVNENRTKGIVRQNSHDRNHQGKRAPLLGSVNISQNAKMGKESLLGRLSRPKEVCSEAVRMDISEDDCRGSGNIRKLSNANGDNNLSGSQNVVGNNSGEEELLRIDPVEQRKETTTTGASLPQWTDEQLNQLFALDCDDEYGFD